MKLIILAADHTSELHPLTLTQPKSLLPVAGVPILERMLNTFGTTAGLNETLVVANQKFSDQFENWVERSAKETPCRITVFNNGSSTREESRGALGDLGLVIRRNEIADDLIVVAGDNLFSHPLESFGVFCQETQEPILGVYDVGRLESAKNYSEVHTDMEGQITSFLEKPPAPETTLIGVALYFFPRKTLPQIKHYLAAGNDPGKPGRLIQWLYPRMPVYTWAIPGIWYDVGSRETLEEANRFFDEFRN